MTAPRARMSEHDIDVAQMFTAARLEAGFTQQQVAEEMAGYGWTPVTVSKVERCQRKLSYAEGCRLAELFGMVG